MPTTPFRGKSPVAGGAAAKGSSPFSPPTTRPPLFFSTPRNDGAPLTDSGDPGNTASALTYNPNRCTVRRGVDGGAQMSPYAMKSAGKSCDDVHRSAERVMLHRTPGSAPRDHHPLDPSSLPDFKDGSKKLFTEVKFQTSSDVAARSPAPTRFSGKHFFEERRANATSSEVTSSPSSAALELTSDGKGGKSRAASSAYFTSIQWKEHWESQRMGVGHKYHPLTPSPAEANHLAGSSLNVITGGSRNASFGSPSQGASQPYRPKAPFATD